MYTARRGAQAVALLFVSTLVSLPASSQSAQFLNVEARSLRLFGPSSSANPCSVNSNHSLAALPGDASRTDSPLFPCDRPMSSTSRRIPVTVVRCNPATQAASPCSAWYRTKDPDPASVFRTLTFALDRDGEVYVRKFPESGGTALIRNPYVA